MKFELRYLISKKYSTIELTEHWIPIILRNKDSILTDSAELPEDMKEYDIVYAIKRKTRITNMDILLGRRKLRVMLKRIASL